jgi:hypothetical protein
MDQITRCSGKGNCGLRSAPVDRLDFVSVCGRGYQAASPGICGTAYVVW